MKGHPMITLTTADRPKRALASHSWQRATPEVLACTWFHDQVASLKDEVDRLGREQGIATALNFYVNPLDSAYTYATLIAGLTLGDVEVPYVVRQHLRYHGEIDAAKLRQLFLQRLHRMLRSRSVLHKRSAAMREAALAAIEEIGHGARLRHMVLAAEPLEEGTADFRQDPFLLGLTLFGDNLRDVDLDYFVVDPDEIRKRGDLLAQVQQSRVEALRRRLANPGKIEIEAVALHLLRLANINPGDVAALEPNHAIDGGTLLKVNGGELTRIQFTLGNGAVLTRFDFEGGYLGGDAVYLHNTLPLALQQGLVGKRINEVVAGGIFDLVDLEIVGIGDLNAGTCLKLKQELSWIDCR